MGKYLDVSNVNTMTVRDSYNSARYLELGVKSCSCTYFRKSHQWGKQARYIDCEYCGTTGRVDIKPIRKTQRGKYVTNWSGTIECPKCYSNGKRYDWSKPETCTRCRGAMVIPQNICDDIPDHFVDSLEIRVYREGTHEHITRDYWHTEPTSCYSCGDYGRHKDLTDAELIADVRKSLHNVQASKLVKTVDKMPHTFAHHIGVLCSEGGYDVRAIFHDSELVPLEQTPTYCDRRTAALRATGS